MGIDIWEVIHAASSKPFGYMPFSPGPGPGGHCIPVDPHYLAWKARQYDFSTRFIELAAAVNESMPYHVVDLVSAALNGHDKSLQGAKVLVLGVAFKKNIDDARESPARRVIETLFKQGVEVTYNDPFIPPFRHRRRRDFPLRHDAGVPAAGRGAGGGAGLRGDPGRPQRL